MPVSTSVHISHCLQLIINLRPKTILDVGCGFGLWGFLCREYLDVAETRVWPDKWDMRIDGIEYFEPYILDHQRYLYDSIQIGDIRDLAPQVDEYDLIITGDVIEHMDKPEAEDVLDTLHAKAKMAMLVNIPIGTGWDHPICHGNPAELHRSEWTNEDFLFFPNLPKMFDIGTLKYGVFLCLKNTTEDENWDAVQNAAMSAEGRGDFSTAARFLERGLKRFPGDESTTLRLAVAYANLKRTDDAVTLLTDALQSNPAFWHGHYILATVLKAASKKGEAIDHLSSILDQSDIDDDLRTRAKTLHEELTGA